MTWTALFEELVPLCSHPEDYFDRWRFHDEGRNMNNCHITAMTEALQLNGNRDDAHNYFFFFGQKNIKLRKATKMQEDTKTEKSLK